MHLNLIKRDPLCVEFVAAEIRQNPALRFNVLVVEDDEFQRWMLSATFGESHCLRIIGEVGDGEKAIEYLRGDGEFSDRFFHPFPDLVLLDLHMPRVNGIEVLEWIRQQDFKDLQVVVLSSSLSPAMIARIEELGPHCYEEKAAKAKQIAEFVKRLEMLMVCRQKCPNLNCLSAIARHDTIARFGHCERSKAA